ncbi:TonB-dependent receptor [Aurantibacter crassamenti]|uniref:TonB-dependent receptor plug domain-containing protein n=1 Tax=Aurantibacter crassamenti TaxID=1837375 RepID=UPI00193A3EF2|nr:TonB-dependent receptor [Aurantibacter crassamenti]MBM1107579.1 TonB-dependent receptor [Aurantibacter crassamenti]
MKNYVFSLVLVLPFCWQLSAQKTPIWELDEVVISDTRVKRYAEGHKVSILTDSTIQRNASSLTGLLSFNSNIYFKENGYGMVSSPAFRGTNASHTAVVWNGININSQMNGQVDFNTINPLNYSSVGIRSGGGSVQFGTGAIGGSVHLNNELNFEKHFGHRLILGYGSFNTKNANYNQSFGNGKWSSTFGINYKGSTNDYEYLETDQKNTNGEFENLSLNFNSGYIISDKHVLRLYHQSIIGDRNLSGNLATIGRSRYKDNQYRTQIEWTHYSEKSVSKLKLAHLDEAFKYFENKDSDIFSEGRVITFLARYSLDIELSELFKLLSFIEYNNYKGEGSSFGSPQRNDVSVTSILKYNLSKQSVVNFSLRQDFSSDFSSPLIFAIDGSHEFSNQYTLQLNASRNFRAPTFNDLYWQPGGNLDLLSERSYQIDLGHQLKFGSVYVNLNSFYIATEDMIRWLPQNNGPWSPTNVDKVQIYGLESEVGIKYPIGKNQNVDFKLNYAYTVSQDNETKEQLIYVPFHRGNASLAYAISDVSLFYQHLYNGPVSIIGGELEGYQVSNMGINYSLNSNKKLNYNLGVTVNNLFNNYYENVALRPMPNRNFQIQLILNF